MNKLTKNEIMEIAELNFLWQRKCHRGIKADLSGADLSSIDLRDIYLWNVNLQNTDFSMSFLMRADFGHANLENSKFLGANLGDADLGYATLFKANLHGADLSRAYLRAAILRDADLTDANLSIKSDLGDDGLAWWQEWKPKLASIIEERDAKKEITNEIVSSAALSTAI